MCPAAAAALRAQRVAAFWLHKPGAFPKGRHNQHQDWWGCSFIKLQIHSLCLRKLDWFLLVGAFLYFVDDGFAVGYSVVDCWFVLVSKVVNAGWSYWIVVADAYVNDVMPVMSVRGCERWVVCCQCCFVLCCQLVCCWLIKWLLLDAWFFLDSWW